ncbi:hypothetical protein SISNIDRAFT_484240 [Sistotremastrum niveocremeum HHB9708]|uniref:S-adenosyl-L-methionine-dependent methyltransferase n=1 Tax=Sistotremastrum niveocremeum HHB9708 TaxID=1314777 RepID=A0A164W368_9AGAM|nr:hypothetical protein SISNIDRAFT_484240 [Sistotremastrum niveocremeum HHB9708]
MEAISEKDLELEDGEDSCSEEGSEASGSVDEYVLPRDPKERDRLNVQHELWKKVMKGICPMPKDALDEFLAAKTNPAIMDLGSGSGVWAVEMAQVYPSARVVGIDLVAAVPPPIPPNCLFVPGSLTGGTCMMWAQYDIVHARLLVDRIKGEVAKEAAINRAVLCLRSGGIIILSNYEEFFVDSDKNPLPPAQDTGNNSSRSWCTRLVAEAFRRPGDRLLGDFYHRCLAKNVKVEKGSVNSEFHYIPVGWDGGEGDAGKEIGEMGRRHAHELFDTCKGILKSKGVLQEKIDHWFDKAQEEISGDQSESKRIFHAVRSVWARKL